MLAGDWDTCVRMANDQISEGAHVLDVCVDYVGPRRHRRHGRDRLPLRHPGQRPARARLHRAPGDGGRPPAHRRPGHPQLGQPGGRRAARQPHRPGVLARPRVRRAPSSACSSTSGARPATSSGSWRSPTASTRSPSSATACRPSDLIFDALTFPLSTGDDDLRRDAMDTIEAIRRIKAEIPGAFTVLGVSNVSLRPSARRPATCSTGCSCTSAWRPASTSAIVHAARIMPLNQIPDEQRDVVPRPHLRPRAGRGEGLRPAARAARGVRRREGGHGREGGPQRLAGRGAAQAPHHRRRPRRPRRRPRRGPGRGHAGPRPS